MNKIFIVTIIAFLGNSLNTTGQVEPDSVTTGASYSNQVFYSMKNGEIASPTHLDWDIAFHTTVRSAAVLTNDEFGVELYTYPHADTSGWNSIDTNGLSNWPIMYDNPTDWEDGAFNRNSKNFPDYGWGEYNMITHDVVGDSIYIIKLLDGSFKKFWIVKKISVENTYLFRFADLDNSNEQHVELNCSNYATKLFVYYSLVDNQVMDLQPTIDTWDVVFTKYMEVVSGMPYPVVGVLNNVNVAANKFELVDPAFTEWYTLPVDTSKSPVGYEWKEFNQQTHTYNIVDSLVYFVQTLEGDIYKLIFTGFGGSATGKIFFTKELISALDIHDQENVDAVLKVYPNPVADYMEISIPETDNHLASIAIYDLSGKIVHKQNISVTSAGSSRIAVTSLKSGLYLMVVQSENNTYSRKIIIEN